MSKVFIYTTPHIVHKALADSINCVGIQTHRTGLAKLPSIGRLIAAKNVYKKIELFDPDLILTESVSTDLLAGAYYKSKHPNTKLVGIVADPKIYEMKSAPIFDAFITKWALDKADLLLVGSQMMYDLMPNDYKYKTVVFYPGIKNISQYLNRRAKFGKNIAFVGQLDYHKGTDILNYIFSIIRQNVSDAKLFVAGVGPNIRLFVNKEKDGIFYVGKTKNSLFLSNVASFYMNLARLEPSGVAVIEAMAQGLVPIVSEKVGYKEFVRKVDPKLVVTSENDIINIYKKLIYDKKLWQKYSKKCKQVVKNLTIKNSINQFKVALKENNII